MSARKAESIDQQSTAELLLSWLTKEPAGCKAGMPLWVLSRMLMSAFQGFALHARVCKKLGCQGG
jgi:hypothetical protein